jgi:hypothetical protein
MVCKHNDLYYLSKSNFAAVGGSKFKVQTPARKVASHLMQINK